LSYSQDALADISATLRMDRCILVYWFFYSYKINPVWFIPYGIFIYKILVLVIFLTKRNYGKQC
jgi:hypothetical protein